MDYDLGESLGYFKGYIDRKVVEGAVAFDSALCGSSNSARTSSREEVDGRFFHSRLLVGELRIP